MPTFQIVQQISAGQKRMADRKVMTIQAIVRFPDGDTTRHLIKQPNNIWTGWNSDRARRVRQGILDSHAAHVSAAKAVETRVGDLETKLAELKGKRGTEATAERKRLRETAKAAKATLAVVKADLERVAAIVKKVDETHPEIVQFV